MQAWLQQLLDAHGYIAITLVILLVNALPSLPAESTMPVIARILASFDPALAPAIAAATLGMVLGTLPLYLLGRLLDERRCMRFLDRHGHWMALSPSDTERSGGWFRRFGPLGVLLGHALAGINTGRLSSHATAALPAVYHTGISALGRRWPLLMLHAPLSDSADVISPSCCW